MKIIDKDVVYKHLSDLEESLKYLKGKKSISEIELVRNVEQRFAIERAFHLAIQNVIDIGSHILASKGINEIETYADVPEKLAEAEIISKSLCRNLVAMAKFRNILVHEYVKIEAAKLISFLNNNLSDFDDFSKAVVKYLS